MEWEKRYPKDKMPRIEDVRDFTEDPLFDRFNDYMQKSYDAERGTREFASVASE